MIDSLSQHITTLLRRNDCVIVPGLGAFVAIRRNAIVSADVMMPPSREVTFNPAMTHDDGLLADSISRRLRISFVLAREKVLAEVELLQRRLRSEGAVHIANVGILSRRSGGRLDFVQESPWLVLPQINVAKPASAPAIEITSADNEEAVAVVRVPLRLRWLRAAAAILVVGLIGFVLSTPIDIDTAQNASLAVPTFSAPEPAAVEALSEPDITLNLFVAPSDGMISAAKPMPAKPMPYIMVVGSLPTYAKAEEFIAETGFSGLNIYQSGDKFRVYISEGETPESACLAAESISGFNSHFPDAWVCRR